MRLPRRWLTGLLLSCVASAACAAPADDESGDGADAVSVAQAAVEPTARAARAMADQLGRAGYREGGLVVLPVAEKDAEFPSEAFGSWRSAAVLDSTKKLVALMLLPAKNAPNGAFGLLMVDADRQVVALAAYVPDAAPDAARVAQRLLEGLPADASRVVTGASGQVSAQGLLSPKVLTEGIVVAARLLYGLTVTKAPSAAAQSAERTLATRLDTAMWRKLEQALDPSKLTNLVSQLAANRIAFGPRSVALVHVEDGIFGAPAVWKALSQRFGSRTSKVALAVPESIENHAVVTWALKNDVPVVVNTITESSPRALLESIALLGNSEAQAIVRAALADPKKLALVRLVDNPKLGMNYVEEQSFVPLWAISDEAFGIMKPSSTDRMFDWFRRFEGALFAFAMP